MDQEKVVFAILLFILLNWGVQFYRRYLAEPISKMLLKAGKVKIAMFVRNQASSPSGCTNCNRS